MMHDGITYLVALQRFGKPQPLSSPCDGESGCSLELTLQLCVGMCVCVCVCVYKCERVEKIKTIVGYNLFIIKNV